MTLKKMSVAANDIVLNNLVMREKTFKTIPYQLCSVLLNLQFYPVQLGKTPACIFKSSSRLLCKPLSFPLLFLILWKFGGLSVCLLFCVSFFLWSSRAFSHDLTCSILTALCSATASLQLSPDPSGWWQPAVTAVCPCPSWRLAGTRGCVPLPSLQAASLPAPASSPGPQSEMHFCSSSSRLSGDFLELLHIWPWEREQVWRASSVFPWRTLFPTFQDLCPAFPFLFLANFWI